MTVTKIHAPFTPEQVAELNEYQHRGNVHPFTCGRTPRSAHKDGEGVLIAAAAGWYCPDDDYTQDWAFGFMAHHYDVQDVI